MTEEIKITGLAALGDGYAETANGRLYVPYSAPGDVYRVDRTAAAGKDRRSVSAELLSRSPERVEPPCRHFEACGGCSLQHLPAATIAELKRARLVQALAHRGLDACPVAATVTAPAGTRRRARFACQKTAHGWIVGFNAPKSKTIIPLRECPVLDNRLAEMPTKLTGLLSRLPAFGPKGDVQVTAGASGVEVCFHPGRKAEPGLDERYTLADWAEDEDLARVCWDGPAGLDPLAARRPFGVTVKGATLLPPPGAFLQASPDGEAAILTAVMDAVGARGAGSRIVDLFAGCGTLSLPLAQAGHTVHAVEMAPEMMDAVHAAGRGQVTTEVRNLARNPLSAEELSKYDCAIFDPPRAGAEEQAGELAQADCAIVVAVSCNAATLTRDLRLLVDGGYELCAVTPIDQFIWSSHLEAVAVLRRAA